jgi:hypothetical protein
MTEGREPTPLTPAEPSSTATNGPRRRRRILRHTVLSLGLLAAAGWLTVSFFSRPPLPVTVSSPSDPRLLYDGPFRNIHPDVAYVGDKSCMPCHADISRSFRRHPMGRSLTPLADAEEIESYDAAHHNPFHALGATFQVERRGQSVWHKETRGELNDRPVAVFETEANYVLGSGTRGRSYLSNRDGYLFQTAISWYSQKRVWDLSPGFASSYLSGRPVPGTCLFCHANRARFRESSLNRYETPPFEGHAIGCERCHGPGERHVASGDGFDIVSPKPGRLTPELCDAVCEQCHLEGVQRVVRRQRGLYDFRPGLPLQDFWRVFVRASQPGEKDRAVTHVEQMHASRCYQGETGTGRMLCISCHDPHVAVAAEVRVAYYRGRCLTCHQDKGCSLPRPVRLSRQADDSCIACHMPRFATADIVHTAATDHRILRRPTPAASKEERHPVEDDGPPTPFHPYRADDEADVRRDLGMALVEMMKYDEASPELHSARAASLLSDAVQRDSADVPAWVALGLTQLMRHRGPEALSDLENALRRDPDREVALAAAATLAWNLGRADESLAYWRRVVVLNPWLPTYRRSLTQLLLIRRQWVEARSQCRDWLRLDPSSAEARQVWIELLLHEGKQDEARREFTRLEALNPPDLARLRIWFKQRAR